VIIQQILAKTP